MHDLLSVCVHVNYREFKTTLERYRHDSTTVTTTTTDLPKPSILDLPLLFRLPSSPLKSHDPYAESDLSYSRMIYPLSCLSSFGCMYVILRCYAFKAVLEETRLLTTQPSNVVSFTPSYVGGSSITQVFHYSSEVCAEHVYITQESEILIRE